LLDASQEAAPRDDDSANTPPNGQMVRCDGEKESSLMAHEVCMCAS
jgi:hypothetical protein